MARSSTGLIFTIVRVAALIGLTRVELVAVRLLRRFAFTLGLMLIASLGIAFLALSAFLGLQGAYGGPIAALVVGFGCLVLALLGALTMLLNTRPYR